LNLEKPAASALPLTGNHKVTIEFNGDTVEWDI
jgi:hypothetical protein